MTSLFLPWEKAETRQVIDLFENHFLKSVFRAAAGKNLAKAIDNPDLIEKRKATLLAAIGVFKQVREKGLNDNPQDRAKIIEAGNHALDRAINTVPKIAPKDEEETMRVFIQTCEAAKLAI